MIYYAILGVKFNSFTERKIEFDTLKTSNGLILFSDLLDVSKQNPKYDEYQFVKYEPVDDEDDASPVELLILKSEMIKLINDEI